jgi:putative Ca2+/H+ antiporter (TMEM165/GDT1 family)
MSPAERCEWGHATRGHNNQKRQHPILAQPRVWLHFKLFRVVLALWTLDVDGRCNHPHSLTLQRLSTLKSLYDRFPCPCFLFLLSDQILAGRCLPLRMAPIPFTDTLLRGFAMIIFSEIGDKTFLIAAILAMRHPRLVVFAGAFGSLLLMSLLSAEMGHLLPNLVPKQWIQIAAGVLFLVFGSKMMMEGRAMKGGNDKIQEEWREAAEEIEGDDAEIDGTGVLAPDGNSISLERLEEGGARHPTHTRQTTKTPKVAEGARNFCNFLLGPVFVQAFVLTFLGEWGDRSQIATIALGATHVRVFQSPRSSTCHTERWLCFLLPLIGCLPCDHRDGHRSYLLYDPCCLSRTVSLHEVIC